MGFFDVDFFVFFLILMLFVGGFFVIYGSYRVVGDKAEKKDDGDDGLVLFAQKLNNLESTVNEADEAVNMLGDMSKNVFKEFDSKYQELLFLYNLIDEKQKVAMTPKMDVVPSVSTLPGGHALSGESAPPNGSTLPSESALPIEPKNKGSIDIIVDDEKTKGMNPKFANVLRLSKEGKDIDEIARQLDMGKGEVMLIINIGGANA